MSELREFHTFLEHQETRVLIHRGRVSAVIESPPIGEYRYLTRIAVGLAEYWVRESYEDVAAWVDGDGEGE